MKSTRIKAILEPPILDAQCPSEAATRAKADVKVPSFFAEPASAPPGRKLTTTRDVFIRTHRNYMYLFDDVTLFG